MGHFNIYHRHDGRFEGRISKGKNESGKRKFQYFYGHSREEVKRKILRNKCKEQNFTECSKTIKEVFDEFFCSIKHRVKESTAANYEMKAIKHIIPFFGSKTIDKIGDSDIYAFIQRKQDEGLSNRYISDIIVLIKAIFKYASKAYHVFNPMTNIEMPKKKKAKITLLSNDEQRVLEQYIAKNPNRTTLGILLSLYTGIRIGELCGLQWKDIDTKKSILTVNKTVQRIQCKKGIKKTAIVTNEPKSESSKRQIPVPAFVAKFLKNFEGNPENYILSGKNKPIEPRTMQYRFR